MKDEFCYLHRRSKRYAKTKVSREIWYLNTKKYRCTM